MTEKDLQLIADAENLSCIDWSLCDVLARKADTKEAKEVLIQKGKELYRLEQHQAGLL